MIAVALWKTLHTPGHDAARIDAAEGGYRLSGTAVFQHDGTPASLAYQLELAADWSTRSGRIRGFVGDHAIERRIERNGSGWLLDGVPQPQVAAAVDLDLGFTPATNYPQLRRMALEVGQAAEICVAWFDLGCESLVPLPQHYRRLAADRYDYRSPQGGYHETLRLAANGFVADYPGLWRLESC